MLCDVKVITNYEAEVLFSWTVAVYIPSLRVSPMVTPALCLQRPKSRGGSYLGMLVNSFSWAQLLSHPSPAVRVSAEALSTHGCLMSWLQNNKPCHFKVSSSLILHNSNKLFLDQIMTWNEKSGFYKTARFYKTVLALPKVKLAPKGHSHSLVVCCCSDPPQLSESWQNHFIWEVCSAN